MTLAPVVSGRTNADFAIMQTTIKQVEGDWQDLIRIILSFCVVGISATRIA
jgi:hypothetical protein